MKRPHRLILASAGTGKTYALTSAFLALVADDVAPERILATTFTRKAAGEIQDRVLRRLAEAADDPAKCKELAKAIDAPMDPARARALLARLTHQLDRLRVRTLDAFFVHLGRLFALELGLPGDWSIADEDVDAALRREAVSRALTDADPQEVLGLLRDLQRADASRRVEDTLLATVGDGRTLFLDSEPAAWSFVQVPDGPSPAEIERALARLVELPLPLTKAGKTRSNWKKARAQILAAAGSGDWKALLEVTLVERVAEGADRFDRCAIEPELRETLAPLLAAAARHVLGAVERHTHAARRWLEHFQAGYAALQLEERVLRFEDLPHLIAPVGGEALGASHLDLWYRVDGRIDHLLLDEFQDTSPSQWRALAPLAEEVLAVGDGARTFFCVGDVKQSIYGWREAEPRLLVELPERYPQLEPEVLAESHRSSPVILDTVNRVFTRIEHNEGIGDRETRLAAARYWQTLFTEQVAANPEKPGAALLLEAQAGEDEDAQVACLRRAAERTQALLDETPQATIGILLRRNKHITRQILLLRDRGVRASGEGGNPLTDSEAVLHALSLLHLVDHPGDSAAAYHLATSPLGKRLELTWPADHQACAEVARRERARLAARGYGGFLEELRLEVAAGYDAWDVGRFDQLVDLAFAWEDRAGTRTSGFVEHVRRTAVEDPSTTQVKVMTIHGAKGLEFDAVLLPELQEKGKRTDPFVYGRPEPAGPIAAVASNVSGARLLDDALGRLHDEHDQRGFVETLCLLYVAMTRAVHRLEMIVPAGQGARGSFAGILRDALHGGTGGEGVVWMHPDGTEAWHAGKPRARDDEGERTTDAPALPSLRAARTPRQLPVRTPSGQEAGTALAADLLRASGTAARARGRLLHRLLQEVEWLADFEATDPELLEIASSLEEHAERRAEALETFRTALSTEAAREVLSRPDDVEAEVWRERRFATVLSEEDGSEALWSGAFDRVVVERLGGKIARACVVDFKTDRVAPGNSRELEARTDRYRPQMEAYRRILAAMTGLPEDAVEARLWFVAAGEVRSIASAGG